MCANAVGWAIFEVVIPVDVSAGRSQQHIEDCPVCCRPNVNHVEIDEDGEMTVWSEAEDE